MTSYKVLQLLLLVSSMMSQLIGMVPANEVKKGIVEGIAQKIEELPKELKYTIFSSALALRENPKYEVYRDFNVGSEVTGIALNADNTRALTGSTDGIARIWDLEKQRILRVLEGHEDIITSVALNADGSIALTGSDDETARVWNMNTGEIITILQVGSSVLSVALSADGTIALTGGHSRTVRLYNTSTGELLNELIGHEDIITSIALNADGSTALTGSDDGTARVWNINTGEIITILQVGSWVSSVALNADLTIALTGTTDSKVLVWNAKSGTLLNTLLTDNNVESVALSKDGKRILTSTFKNGNIQVWNTKPLPGQKETSTPLTVLEGHTDSVCSLAFGSADFIASSSDDGTALIWKPFALELRDPLENEEILKQTYKETFPRPKFLFPDEKDEK